MKKTVGEGLGWLGVTIQNNFQYDQLLKEIGHFKLTIYYRSAINKMSSFLLEKPTSMYLGRISKICLNSSKLIFYITSVNRGRDWNSDMMVSERATTVLKCVHMQVLYA